MDDVAESEPGSDPDPGAGQRQALVALYDSALPEIYGYLYRRCGSPALAEDLTSETFLAAADAVRRRRVPSLTVAWLVTVARNKLVDHWRRAEREQRTLDLVPGPSGEEPWDSVLDRATAQVALGRLSPQHRCALTLRYLDGLSVPETAACLDRTVGATEVLLVRARRAFRHVYQLAGVSGEDR
jgi:RNA polymerase sigma-70 factor (ECF subfamily)